jgi:hypothetical protein
VKLQRAATMHQYHITTPSILALHNKLKQQLKDEHFALHNQFCFNQQNQSLARKYS